MTSNLPFLMRVAARARRLVPTAVLRAIYRSPRLARALRGRLNAVAPRGLADVEIAAGPLRGARFRLDLHSEKDYWLASYEPDLMRALAEIARPGAVAFDVGANVGYVTLALARLLGPTGHVVAVEPLPANVERLRHHVTENGAASNVTVVAAAASDRPGTATFLVHESGAMGKLDGSAGRRVAYEGKVDVACVRLDDLAFGPGGRRPDLLKIDVEGGAVRAMPGLERVLAEARPVLLVELHGPEERHAVLDAFARHRYHVFGVEPAHAPVDAATPARWGGQVVAVPAERPLPWARGAQEKSA